jgi:hypothetical protein
MKKPQGTENIAEACLECIAYFGIFNFPLKAEEIHQYVACRVEPEEVHQALDTLVADGQLVQYEGYYLTENKPDWIKQRLEGHKRALHLLERSNSFIRIIAAFPFVRAIAISGSLSKFAMGKTPDIDYFIITDPGRLWIARSLLHVFKKLSFITGHQHYFCMNYFIDTQALALKQRNQYVAIELATLLPVYNQALIKRLMLDNKWIDEFLPNHPGITRYDYLIRTGRQGFKRLMESIISFFSPCVLNKKLMEFTDRRWRKKWTLNGYSVQEYEKAMQTELHISKNHPEDYEEFVLNELAKRRNT